MLVILKVGTHVRIPDGKIGNDERIERNWSFWSVFVQVSTTPVYLTCS